MAALYICYQSVLDPLTQTQVVAYLEGLARAGHAMLLLTFEPRALSRQETRARREALAAKGVRWSWVRYHKAPTVPATAYDIVVGTCVGLGLVLRHGVDVVHVRNHVSGLMGLAITRATGAALVFDIRGFMAEEYVDAGRWPAGGRLFHATKAVERWLVREADGLVVITHKARELLHSWYGVEAAGKPLEVIPCCVDLRHAAGSAPVFTPAPRDRVLAYVGKLGGWYMVEEIAAFFAAASRHDPAFRFRVWTQSDATPLLQALRLHGVHDLVTIAQVAPEMLGAELARVQASVSFIRPSPSKLSSSPTKIGEYLAAGAPVVSTRGIGDVDELLVPPLASHGGPVGVLIDAFDARGCAAALRELDALLRDPEIAARCRAAARSALDLERIGWTRYQRLYDAVAAGRGRATSEAPRRRRSS